MPSKCPYCERIGDKSGEIIHADGCYADPDATQPAPAPRDYQAMPSGGTPGTGQAPTTNTPGGLGPMPLAIAIQADPDLVDEFIINTMEWLNQPVSLPFYEYFQTEYSVSGPSWEHTASIAIGMLQEIFARAGLPVATLRPPREYRDLWQKARQWHSFSRLSPK